MRARTAVAAIVLVLLGLGMPGPVRADQPAAAGITITGVDSHDGQIYQDGNLYYWVGTRYGCGFRWGDPSTPWCGFGVWSATAPAGPWTFLRALFDPAEGSGTYYGEDWQTVCRGDGCFNPRMIRRPDGAWILWFSGGHDLRVHNGNAFWVMGCNGPAGPCGRNAGPPYGSTIKPGLWICRTGGDHAMFVDPLDGAAYLVCGTNGWRIDIEKLDQWWAGGTGIGATSLAGLSYVEGVGMFRAVDNQVVMTFGDNCPFCSGTNTSYAVAASPLGPFHLPPGSVVRGRMSGTSCGGQPRSIALLNGQPYELIDTWYDQPNETNAATRLEPLVRTGAGYLDAPNGTPWVGPFHTFTCETP